MYVTLTSIVQQQLFCMWHIAMWPLSIIATACIKVGCRNYVKLGWQLYRSYYRIQMSGVIIIASHDVCLCHIPRYLLALRLAPTVSHMLWCNSDIALCFYTVIWRVKSWLLNLYIYRDDCWLHVTNLLQLIEYFKTLLFKWIVASTLPCSPLYFSPSNPVSCNRHAAKILIKNSIIPKNDL